MVINTSGIKKLCIYDNLMSVILQIFKLLKEIKQNFNELLVAEMLFVSCDFDFSIYVED